MGAQGLGHCGGDGVSPVRQRPHQNGPGGVRVFTPFHPGDTGKRAQGLFHRIGLCRGHADRYGIVGGDACQQLLGGAIGHEAPPGDDDGPAADRLHLFENMGGNDDGLVRRHVADQAAHVMFLVGIKAVGRLVENQYVRVVQQGLGQTHPSFEALGQGVDGLGEDIPQGHPLHHRGDSPRLFRPRIATHLGDEGQEPLGRHVAIGRRSFGQVAESGLGREWLGDDVKSADPGRAGGGGEKARHHFHGGGFAGPVGTKEGQNLSPLHRQADAIGGHQRAEFPAHSVKDDHCRHCPPLVPFLSNTFTLVVNTMMLDKRGCRAHGMAGKCSGEDET
ncbi:MAG: Uncharacterized protein FD149_1082 [Rhodospirillaceae bacterium]|nr:MAG: Uncharacterized protein FD149_1082 [Rhodospirillaceae bacterium]